MEFGEYLRNLRVQKGLTITQVVVKSNHEIDKTTISRVESGTRKLSLKNAWVLAKIYSIGIDSMVEMAVGEKAPPPEPPFDISPEEKRLIFQYRKLSPVLRVAMKNIFSRLALGAEPCGGNYLRVREEEAVYEVGEAIMDDHEKKTIENRENSGGV